MAGRLLTYIREYYGGDISDGITTIRRDDAASASLVTQTGALRLTFFTAPRDLTTARVRMYSGSTAAAATPTLVRVGLYAVDAAGDGTLVASTVNDTSLFASQNTAYTVDWDDPYDLAEGERYAVGLLVVSAQTTPTVVGSAAANAAICAVAPRLSGAIGSQTDLPASFVESGLSTAAQRMYAALLVAA